MILPHQFGKLNIKRSKLQYVKFLAYLKHFLRVKILMYIDPITICCYPSSFTSGNREHQKERGKFRT